MTRKTSTQGARSTHPLRGDLYTPITPEVLALFDRMRERHGSWRQIAAMSNTRLKVLRRIRRDPTYKAISMSKLDDIITATGVGSLDDYVWFTADDLVAMGIWEKPADPVDGFPVEWKERRRGKR